MTAGGVPAGATSPNHPRFSKPGTVSATAGTFGSCGERCLLVTASARILPAVTKPIAAERLGVST
ncbi:hypothetical protein D3C83_111130 [compost metagenome]